MQRPLSPRPEGLCGKTIYLLQCWPVASEFYELDEKLGEYLLAKYPGVNIRHVTKEQLYSADEPELWEKMRREGDAFVYFAAPSCSTTAYAVAWPARVLESKGLPGVTVIYSHLEQDAVVSQEREGVPVRYVCVPYPPAQLSDVQTEGIMEDIGRALLSPLTPEELVSGIRAPKPRKRIVFEGTEDEAQDYFHSMGWTDGLPIVVPTEERVARMLTGTSHGAAETVTTTMAPEGRRVSVEDAAVCAVMAGAEPKHFAVILTAIEIMGNVRYQTTTKSTNSFSFMQVVSGPIRNEIGMNCSTYALGPGNRANAVIGRALRLALINLGGAEVGVNLMGIQGNVSSYTFAFAENEESSPWESLGVSQGFSSEESVLTIFSGGWNHCGNFQMCKDLTNIMEVLVKFEQFQGVALLLSPQRAKMLAEAGFTKQGIEDHVQQNCRMSMKDFRAQDFYTHFILPDLKGKGETWPEEYLTAPDDAVALKFPKGHIYAIVVGDPNGVPMMQGWTMYNPNSASIDKWR